jgi:hypothetical protein
MNSENVGVDRFQEDGFNIILVITKRLKLLAENSVRTESLGLFRAQRKDISAEIKHAWTCVLFKFFSWKRQPMQQETSREHKTACIVTVNKGLLLWVEDISKQVG